MKYIRKILLVVFILPVIFLTVACSYDSKGDNDTATSPSITQPDSSTNDSDNNQNVNDFEEGPENNNDSDNDLDNNLSDSGSSENNPNNPNDEGDKENSAEEINPSDEEINASTENFKICFEIETCGIPIIVEKFNNPSNIISLFPEATFSCNSGEVYYVENILDKYAIHFLNQKNGEICTTEIEGKQYLELELCYSSWNDFEIIINDYAQTIERNDGGISNISFKFEIKQDSSFTLNLFVL